MKTKPTHNQMMKRPSLWYNEFLDCLKIVYPDIYTQDTWENFGHIEGKGFWTDWANSTSVIRAHYEFLGWL